MELIFEWNENKAKANLRNHKISFDEAKTIFNDANIITFPDELHSQEEERFISIGFSTKNRILLVVHTEKIELEGVIIIRIISCRRPTALERKIYEE